MGALLTSEVLFCMKFSYPHQYSNSSLLIQIGRIKQKRGYKDQWPWNIKIYTDEKGNQKGDAVLSYEDPQAAHSAGGFFNSTYLQTFFNQFVALNISPHPCGIFFLRSRHERLYNQRGYGREDCT